jgi:predicted lactoylglutathione lyase
MKKSNPSFSLTVVTLGVSDVARSVRFYEDIGLTRKVRATGDEVAFFDAGGVVLALWSWDKLAEDATLARDPRPAVFRGVTLACNCVTDAEVDAVLAHAVSVGGTLLKPAHSTHYGGHSGYFADPDGHVWEVVRAPVFTFTDDGRLVLPD